jgi:hypothetical protein
MSHNFFIKSFFLCSDNEQPEDKDCFNEYIDIEIGTVGTEEVSNFKLNVISEQWLCEHIEGDLDNNGFYLKYGLILHIYDEKEIKQQLQEIINKCNSKANLRQAFYSLKHHLEYDQEYLDY